jgi:hypothetical protein
MRVKGHRRSQTANRTVAIVAALVVGGGGAAAIGVSAFAGSTGNPAPAASTIDCPDVSLALGQVPKGAKEPVAQKLATLDQQVAQAYSQWNSQEESSEAALGQLKQQRSETIQSMGQDIQKAGGQAPGDMQSMAQCRMMQDQATQEGQQGGDDGQQVQGPVADDFVDITQVQPNASKEDDPGGSFETKCGNNENEHFNSDNVIAAAGVLNGAHHVHDYVGNEDTNSQSSDESLAAARTTCAKGDQSTHYWPVIRSLDGNEDQRGAVQEGDIPKEPQGQRTGDDAGQDQGQDQGTDQGQDQGQEEPPAEEQDQGQEQPPAEDQGQDAGVDQGQDQGQEQPPADDQGQDQGQEQPPAEGQDQGQEHPPAEGQDQGQDQGQGQDEGDKVGGGQGAEAQPGDGGANDLNVGSILQPDPTIKLTSGGADRVIEMPRFLRIITGDAKSFTNGDENANASWSCEGFEDRQLKDKYPICPEGKKMIRTFKFQNCWDGQNTDSGNHRDHMQFSDDQGNCPEGFQNIPQVQQTIKYDIPQQNLLNADTPFAVDSFPEQLHKPITDHSDFINVMPNKLMKEAVDCINENKDCPGDSKDSDSGKGTDSGSKPDKPSSDSKPDKPSSDSKPAPSKPDDSSKSDSNDSQSDKPSSDSKADKPASDSKSDDSASSSKQDEPASAPDSKSDDSASSNQKRDDSASASDSKSDDSVSSSKQDESTSAVGSESDSDDPTPEAVNRDEDESYSAQDESTQLAKDQDGDLPGTGSDTPVALILGIAAVVVAAGGAQVWWLRRRNARY